MYTQWINLLLKVDLFKHIEVDELNKILLCIRPNIKSYKRKEIITMEKSDLIAIGIILQGEVIITKETLSGDRVFISRMGVGDIFGEVAAFASNECLETVEAEADSVILFLSSDKIIGVCSETCSGHKRLIQNMLQIVSKKALLLNKKVEILSLKTIRKKISTYLLEQYNKNNSFSFSISLNRNELSEYLVVPRPSLSRELVKMQEEEIIDFHRNSFKILNLEKLKESLSDN